MRKIVEIISVISLILIIILLITSLSFLYEKQKQLNDMYEDEVFAEVAINDFKHYTEVMTALNNIEGVEVSNASYPLSSDVTQNILYTDEIYYNKFIKGLELKDGRGFNSNDFTFIFDDTKPIPILVTEDYSNNNNIQVGDKIFINDWLPDTCFIYGSKVGGIKASDGSFVENSMPSSGNECQYDNPYEYLNDENSVPNIPAEVIGIISKSEEVHQVNMEHTDDNLIIVPTYIVDNADMKMYDLDSYLNNKPIYSSANGVQWMFIDYGVISPNEFEDEFENIQEKYNTSMYLYTDTDTVEREVNYEKEVGYQVIVSEIYALFIILVFYISNLYYRLKYKEYKISIYHLLGIPTNIFLKVEIKEHVMYDFIEFIILLLILLYFRVNYVIILGFSVFIFLKLIEYISLVLKYKTIVKKNLNSIFIEGEL